MPIDDNGGMNADALTRTLEEFLTEASGAIVLEDGAVMFDLAQARYSISGEHNKCVLFVRQDRVGADQQDRQADGTWQARALTTPEAPLTFPGIGSVGRLGDLYKFTPLDPFARA